MEMVDYADDADIDKHIEKIRVDDVYYVMRLPFASSLVLFQLFPTNPLN